MAYLRMLVRAAFTSAVAVAASGCGPEVARLRQSIAHPGPASYQRGQAIQHDPYLLDDVGPEVVGARPREYQRPLNEVERARLAAPVPPGVQAAAPRTIAGPPTPIAAPPYPLAPAPTATAYPAASAPIVTTPAPATPLYPAAPAPPTVQFQNQPRAPY